MEQETVCDLFSLIPLPQTTSLPPQESSLPASKEQGANIGLSATETVVTEMEQEPVFFDLFPLICLPQTINLPPQKSSEPASKEQGVDTLLPITSTVPPQHLPADDQATNVQREKGTASSPCVECSHSSVCEDKGNASVYTHTNPDPLEESIQPTSGVSEHSMATSFSLASPSTETASQTVAESNIEARDSTDRKEKQKKPLSVVQQKRQRMLNKVSALHYRQRKKGKMSDLDIRKEQLEAENARLKEQVSVLTTEIAKFKRLSNTQKAKFCPFFLHSTCNKIKQL
jgi:hypothetical protein